MGEPCYSRPRYLNMPGAVQPRVIASGRKEGARGDVIQGRFIGSPPWAIWSTASDASGFPLPKPPPSGPGEPMPSEIQAKMEAALSANFSDVRVHVGPQAPAIGALTYTRGSNIYFAPGQYSPTTYYGQQLLGHELTHVLQQRAGRVSNPFRAGVAAVQDPAMEAEARQMGMRVAATPFVIQRAEDGDSSSEEDEDTMGWPETINFANKVFRRRIKDGNVYYQMEPRERATEVYISIHNPGTHFLKWGGELWCKAHVTRNKFVSVRLVGGEVANPEWYGWIPQAQYRKDTDPNTQGEYDQQFQRACGVGKELFKRLKIKKQKAFRAYISSFK